MSTNISEGLKKTLDIIGGSESTLSGIIDDNSPDIDAEPKAPAVFEVKQVPSTVKPTEPDGELSDIQQDYIAARNITHTLIAMVGQSLAGALAVATDTEHPRAYGVFNELAVTMRGLAQDLVGLHKVHKEATKGTADEPKPAVVNNTQNNINTANMSTTEVIKFLASQQGQEVVDAEVIDNG